MIMITVAMIELIAQAANHLIKIAHRRNYMLVLAVLVSLTGCDQSRASRTITSQTGASIKRVYDRALINQGAGIFRAHCAVCHGANAEGDANWRKSGPDGKYPPPPLNGTAHEWHHSIPVLREIIKNGTPPAEGNMPAWDGKLTDQEIDAVIAWFQSLWPDQIYAAWYEMQERARKEP